MTKRRRALSASLSSSKLLTGLLLAAACGGPQKLGDSGATCFRDDDCVAGLICVAPTAADTRRVCSNDPTPLISMVEGPPVNVGGAAGAAGAAGTAGAAGAAGAGAVAGGGAGGTTAGGAPSAGNAGAGSNAGGNASAGNAAGGTAGTSGNGGTAGASGSAGTAPDGGAPL